MLRGDAAGGADADAPTGGGHEPATRAADAALTVAAAPAPTRAAPSASHATAETLADDAFSELTRSMGGVTGQGGEAEEGATRAMQRAPRRPRRSSTCRSLSVTGAAPNDRWGLSVAIPLVVLALIFRPRRPPPEVEIEWPKDAAGSYLDQFEPAPSGGYKEADSMCAIRATGTFKRKAIEGGMMLDGSRPLDGCADARGGARGARGALCGTCRARRQWRNWMQQVADSGGRWNFDRPVAHACFLRPQKRYSIHAVTNLRDGDGTWFGVASEWVLYGDRRLVAAHRGAATERMRAEKMMSVKLILAADAFEFAYWRGVPGAASLVSPRCCRQIPRRLGTDRAGDLGGIRSRCCAVSLLTQAVQAGHREVENRGARAARQAARAAGTLVQQPETGVRRPR